MAPSDGFAKVHVGFILKAENNFKEAIPLLTEGIASGEQGTNEGKYYVHLGDALFREGQIEEVTFCFTLNLLHFSRFVFISQDLFPDFKMIDWLIDVNIICITLNFVVTPSSG